MRQYNTLPARIESKEQLAKVICDWCGKEDRDASVYGEKVEWSGTAPRSENDNLPSRYGLREVSVFCKWGTNYPEGGCGEYIEIDMCMYCFREKLVPLLKEQGVEIKERGWDI